MITAILISLIVGFIAGALVFRKHASRAAQLEAKGKTILDVLKGR